MRLVFTAFLFICSASFPAFAQSKSTNVNAAEIRSVQKASESFVSAFNNLEWETIRNSFTADTTVFFPYDQRGDRV